MPDMPYMTDMPYMPFLPDMPDMTGMPYIPDMPYMTVMSELPDMQNMPDISDMPDMQYIPDMSFMPVMPNIYISKKDSTVTKWLACCSLALAIKIASKPSKDYSLQLVTKTSLLRRLQTQTLPNEAPTVDKIYQFSKIAVNFVRIQQF